MLGYPFVYVVDDRGFPYGSWEDRALRQHLSCLFARVLEQYKPLLCVIACNTASTLMLDQLRANFPNYCFVGTVPAIKPAAACSLSGLISVLATPGTVHGTYTRNLITAHAGQCSVYLVGSKILSIVAESYLRGIMVDLRRIQEEIFPCFVQKNGKRTDIVVLACTHYHFLKKFFHDVSPWPVLWLDPSEAIVQRIVSLLPSCKVTPSTEQKDIACFTSGRVSYSTRRLFHGFGLICEEMVGSIDLI
jgi:glutamate racemase